jgi:hypothetical protein
MSRRIFPLAAGVTPLLSGCLSLLTPGIVGDWTITDWTVGGEDRELSYSDQGYDVDWQLEVSVDDDLEAEVDVEVSIVGPSYDQISRFSYSGEAEKADRNEWDLSLTSEEDNDLDLTCVLEDDELLCEGEFDDGTETEMTFEPED